MSQLKQELTEKGKANLAANEEMRKQQGAFIKMAPGEKIVLLFNAENIEQVETEFEGKKSIKYQYTVVVPDTNETKTIRFSKTPSSIVDAFLKDGYPLLKIHRMGEGKATQYLIAAA